MLLKYWYDDISNVTWVSFGGQDQSFPGLVYKKEIHERYDQIVFEVLKDEEGLAYFLPAGRPSSNTGESIECTTIGSDSPQEQDLVCGIQSAEEPSISANVHQA